MYHHIRVSVETFTRLKAVAEPYVDREPEDTIRRLLALVEDGRVTHDPSTTVVHNDTTQPSVRPSVVQRAPRERGVVVDIGQRHFQAVSVRDLYEQVLIYLVDEHTASLDQVLPFGTSRQRHLIAKSACHPTGNEFVVPVRYKGYYMEAHKDYKNAISHLGQLAMRLGLPMQVA